MKLPHRRQFLHLAAGAATLPPAPYVARAQAYPSRPVHVIVGFPAGSAADILARLFGQWLSERLGPPFIVEIQPGAGGNIATEAVVRASPDGHTLLMVTGSNAVNATLYANLNYNFIRDIAPVIRVTRGPLLMAVNSSFPANTVPEFVSYAKANPGKINMASAGSGGTTHLVGELFKLMAGIDMVHVPYRGSTPALADLLVGKVQVMFDLAPVLVEPIKTGKLRPLAITIATRSQALPEIPAMSDFVPGFEAAFWGGVGAPKDTSTEIINKLNQEISAALVDPRIRARIADAGYIPFESSPADFGAFIADETEKWGKVIRAANIKPE
jgi:tripartite-type tricarboxylate transporter receptor subunit TctC